jgi:hypothetical protein
MSARSQRGLESPMAEAKPQRACAFVLRLLVDKTVKRVRKKPFFVHELISSRVEHATSLMLSDRRAVSSILVVQVNR